MDLISRGMQLSAHSTYGIVNPNDTVRRRRMYCLNLLSFPRFLFPFGFFDLYCFEGLLFIVHSRFEYRMGSEGLMMYIYHLFLASLVSRCVPSCFGKY